MTYRISIQSLLTIAFLVVLGWILYQAVDALLLLVAAVFIAAGLHQAALRISRWLPGGRRIWLLALVLITIGFGAGLYHFAGPRLAGSFTDLVSSLQDSWANISSSQWLQSVTNGESVDVTLENALSGKLMAIGQHLTSLMTGVVNVVTGALLIVALALFLAWNPYQYERGLLSLFPKKMRPRLNEVTSRIGSALWYWCRGQGISMIIIGVLTGLGLWLIGMKFALILGLIAGVFQIIPFVGPILSSIPGITLALAVSPSQAIYVAAIYLGVQLVESHIITPMVQQSEASLPPLVTLIATVAFGMVFGPLGLIIATPLALVILVIYRELYGELVLNEDIAVTDNQLAEK